jgi:hypothetical protein
MTKSSEPSKSKPPPFPSDVQWEKSQSVIVATEPENPIETAVEVQPSKIVDERVTVGDMNAELRQAESASVKVGRIANMEGTGGSDQNLCGKRARLSMREKV